MQYGARSHAISYLFIHTFGDDPCYSSSVMLYKTAGLTSPALYRKVLSMAEAAAVSPPDLQRAARRGLAIYFALLVVISGSLEAYYIFINPELLGTLFALLALMWSPAVASVIARLVLREGFSDVSFRFGGYAPCRGTRLAWACPSPSASSPTAAPG
jgi:hypothetical protein